MVKCVKVKGKEGNKVKDMKKYDLSGFQILEFEELDSTNTKAAELLKGGLEDRSVVLTFRQTKGKGISRLPSYSVLKDCRLYSSLPYLW